MKRILLSSLVILGVVGLSLGATRAFFTDTAVLGDVSTLSSGVLSISANDSSLTAEPETFVWELKDVVLAPGEETVPFSVTLKNDGTINLGWVAYFEFGGNNPSLKDVIYIKEAKTEFKGPNGDWESLDKFILNGTGNVDVANNGHSWNSHYVTLANNSSPYHVITLGTWNNDNAMGAGGGVMMGALKANPAYYYRFTFKLAMVPEAGNSYMGKSMDLSYKVHATQLNADALNTLFSGDSRLQGLGSNHLAWMNLQIAKQN